MSVDGLASEIQTALGQRGAVSARNKALAKAVVLELQQSGVVAFAPATITGTAPPGALVGGAGMSGKITGLLGPSFALIMAADLGEGPPTPEIINLGNSITSHVMTGTVAFKRGTITGTDTNTAVSGGTMTGAGMSGTISGLSGPTLAGLIAPAENGTVSPTLKAMCQALVDHIQKNAVVSFAFGTVTGATAPASAPLAAGAAMKGSIL